MIPAVVGLVLAVALVAVLLPVLCDRFCPKVRTKR